MRVQIDHPGPRPLQVAFDAPPGITGIFGPSGAGKTTLLDAVAGVFRPQAATILKEDQVFQNAQTFLRTDRRGVGYVFQQPRLFPHLNVAQNLTFAARFGRDTGGFDAIVDMCGLAPLLDRMPQTLSGGEQARVAIARAVLSDPSVLLLDEPLSGLDASRKADILPILEHLRDTTTIPILYVSHDIAEITRLAHHVLLLRNGTQRAFGPIEEVLSNPALVAEIGARNAGAVLRVTYEGQDGGLSRLSLGTQHIVSSGRIVSKSETMRLRVAAQDIILSLSRPEGISAINVLEAQVSQLHAEQGEGIAVGLEVDGQRLVARITQSSAKRLALREGQLIYAILKATAFDPDTVG